MKPSMKHSYELVLEQRALVVESGDVTTHCTTLDLTNLVGEAVASQKF